MKFYQPFNFWKIEKDLYHLLFTGFLISYPYHFTGKSTIVQAATCIPVCEDRCIERGYKGGMCKQSCSSDEDDIRICYAPMLVKCCFTGRAERGVTSP